MVFVDSVKFGEIVIDGKVFYSDMLLSWDGTIEMRPKSQIFRLDDYEKLKDKKPDTIVIGCGMEEGLMIEEGLTELIERDHIDFFVERTPQAVRLFNSLMAAKRHVIAVIHTTC